MRTGTISVLTIALMATGGLWACGDSPGGESNNNNFIPCEGIEDCPPGYECISNVCVPPDDGGVGIDGSTDPDIEVDPVSLDFGNPLLNVAVEQSLTITNVGGEDLTIFSILLQEDDTNLEYDATPVGNLARVLTPGESMVVDVQLINVDEQADTGQLVINSDDLDEAMTVVPLVSELKGDGLLSTCVMETTDMYGPCVTNPEIIDFGPVSSTASVTQDVSVFNGGTGNTPLLVEDIYVTNNSGYVGQFQIDIARFVEDPANPGTYIEELIPNLAANPYLLEVNDGTGAPEVLMIHVQFDAVAALEGQPVPQEFLVIQTDDASNLNYQIPFAGDVLCPDGWVELDGISPWCEYQCTVTNGGVEDCDGADNNCDGVIDEGCPVCGNGVVEGTEVCDDGNQDNSDNCPDGVYGTCEWAVCGDGFTQTGVEECDDGNGNNSDDCLDDTSDGGNCEIATCGDGYTNVGVEECDDGNHDNYDDCPDGVFGTCLDAYCGDGFIQTGSAEECDPPDGSTCSNTCQIMSTFDPSGCYDINLTVNCQCAWVQFLGLYQVDFRFDCVQLFDNGTTLTAVAQSTTPWGQPCNMNGTSVTNNTFTANCTLTGGCAETYTISGTFSDNDHWDGTFMSNFSGSCSDCLPVPAACGANIVNATRVDCSLCTAP